MSVSVSYSSSFPFLTEVANIILSSLEIGEELTLYFATGAVMTHIVTSTDVATETGLLETAMDVFAAAQGADGIWDTVSTTDNGTDLDAEYDIGIGHLFVISDEGGSVTTKIWRGDAPAVAQVSTVTPANIEVGDAFYVTINGKSITFTATAATAANVCDGLAALIAASTIAEFGELTASSASGVLTLTANTPGVPFVATAGTTQGGISSVVVATTTQGGPPTSEVQTFTIPSEAVGASWTISFGGQTTTALAIGDSAATVDAALEALSTIGAGDVSVGKSGDIYTVTFGGALANTAVAPLVVALYLNKPLIRVVQEGAPFGPAQNEIVSVLFPDSDVDAFTYQLTYNSETSSARAYTPGMAFPLVYLTDWPTARIPIITHQGGNLYYIEFTDALGDANIGTVSASSTWSAAQGRFDIAVTETTAGTAGGNEVQTVTLTPTPTGGTFTLTYSGQTTSAIAYNASAATVDAALEALSNIGAGDVAVTGSAGGPWTVTFGTALANTNVAEMTGSGASLTGASTQTFTVVDVTASAGPNHWDTAANWIPSGVPATGDDVRFEIGSSDCLYGLLQTAVTLLSLHVAMSWRAKLGLPRQNPNDYVEYRTCELTAGVTTLVVGTGDGSGPSKVAVNTGSVQTAITIRGSGGSSDTGLPAVLWRGSHASNAVTVIGGDFGSAPYSDQSAVLASLQQYGGSVFLNRTAISGAINVTGQSFRAYECTHNGQVLNT